MDKMVKIVFVSLLVVVGVVVFFTPSALADTPELTLEHSPPCLLNNLFGNCVDPTNSFAAYIKRIYQFGLGIAGALAILMIVIGAMRRVVSAGNPGQIEEGNNMIKSALVGILLLFGSYLILRTINPELVTLKDPSAENVSSTPYRYQPATSTVTGVCPNQINTTACFFNPETLTNLDPRNSSNVGTAIDAVTLACVTQDCICENCRPVSDQSFPAKLNACGRYSMGQGSLGECFMNTVTARRFTDFKNAAQALNSSIVFSRTGWRMSEAFPPTSPHQSSCHYNGQCFDIGKDVFYNPTNPGQPRRLPRNLTPELCIEIRDMAIAARRYFRTVLIEAAPVIFPNLGGGPGIETHELDLCVQRRILSNSQISAGRYTSGIHLHIQNPVEGAEEDGRDGGVVH